MNFKMPLFSRGRSSRSTSKISAMNLQPRSSIKNDIVVEGTTQRPQRKLFSETVNESTELPPGVIAGSIKQESTSKSKPAIGTEKIISKVSNVKRRSVMPLLFQEKPKTKYFTQKMEEDASKWKHFIGKSTSEYVSGNKPDDELIHNPKHSNVLGIEKKRYGPSWDPYTTSIEDDFKRLPKNTFDTLETLPKNNGRPQEVALTEIKNKEIHPSIEKSEDDRIMLEITEKLQQEEKIQKTRKVEKEEKLDDSTSRPQVRTVSVPNHISQEEEDLALPTWLRKNKNGPSFFLIDKKQTFSEVLKEKKEIESWDDEYLPSWLRKNKK